MIERLSSRYTVLRHIASGAMGELYLARDNRLEREVAVKVLRPEFARDADRCHRLRREARLLASLDHPNVAAVHDLEENDGALFLVLEFVPGPTLAERMASGPLPMPEALSIAMQLAAGLEAAHGHGVIHRDFKPANIVLAAEGQAKVLDFGLAKSISAAPSSGDPWEPSSLTHHGTTDGVLLGTVGYMSPEQARGLATDRRADIWAFGCVLFEMLTGARAFRGDTATDTLVRILEHEPAWHLLPRDTPTDVRTLLQRCLTKDARHRLRDIGEAWIALDRALSARHDSRDQAVPASRRRGVWVAAPAVILIAAVGLIAFVSWRSRSGVTGERGPRLTYEIPLPNGTPLGGRVGPSLAISPDGTLLICAEQRSVWIHAMDSLGFQRSPRGRTGFDPVFSPDGRYLVVRGGRGLERQLLADGSFEAIETAYAPSLRGVAWGSDDSLVYAPGFATGLWKVSARGGRARAITELDSARGEVTHRWPDVLPGGRRVIFTVRTRYQPTFDQADIAILDLPTGRRRTLIPGGTCARYVHSGHIVFARGDLLLAVPFDLRSGRLTGPPAVVVQGVDLNPTTGAAQFGCSHTGTLVYAPAVPGGWTNKLAWLGRDGAWKEELPLPGLFENPDVSPDGRRVAFTVMGAQNDIAVFDLDQRVLRRVTFDPGEDTTPIWSPDGIRLAYSSARDGALNLYWCRSDGTGQEERLTRSALDQSPSGWSPDGRMLLYTEESPETGTDLWMVDVARSRRTLPFLRTPFTERAATFSPCGRWVAYESDESGRSEIYVRSFGSATRWTQVSTSGGTEPQWSPSGDELFFMQGSAMMSAPVRTVPRFEAGRPRLLFDTRLLAVPAVSHDARRFIAITEVPQSDRVVIRTGWFQDLRRLAPRS
jgi:hypothetical protein